MRYDLVVNTFVRDALVHRRLTLHHGGEMWRPLVDVRDAAQAYIALVEAEERRCAARCSTSATGTCASPSSPCACRRRCDVSGSIVDVRPDYHQGSVRNYRVSGDKIGRVLNFRPKVSIEESVTDMVERIRADGRTDLENPRYYNIRWLQLLEDDRKAAGTAGSVLDAPPTPLRQ